ncbi:diguanylate cyclase [Marimonas arenosa]|uniref:diguanylate cyclase n=1 Tax=Marimonas arenosa TaxID=1795305 RepID=A0AAE4B5Q2_9RHOB|nr:diguanylate cyclase [Marimonas arenosa]MDQ2092253.1 diguanylate cyclase [Marimonas arenosa]
MPGNILIVDPIATNRIVRKVKLTEACYQVAQAVDGAEGLAVARLSRPDLILCAAALPDMTPAAFAQSLRQAPQTQSIPLVVETVEPGVDFRYDLLAAGADDILNKPYEDRLLLARLRSLLRVRETAEELNLREGAHRALGLSEEPAGFTGHGRVALVAPTAEAAAEWRDRLSGRLSADIAAHAATEAIRRIVTGAPPDVIAMVLTDTTAESGLQLLADLRAKPETRDAGVLVLIDSAAAQRLAADALDRGASDVITGGVSAREIALRLSRQIIRKQTIDRLRADMRNGLRAALTDPLTGLFNRRYAMPRLADLAAASARGGGDFAAMIIDVDFFKMINDRFGHTAGDGVLTRLAAVLRGTLGDGDLLARIGGEEFLVVLPDASRTAAQMTARRICKTVRETPFHAPGHRRPLQVTVSIGVAFLSDALAARQAYDQPLPPNTDDATPSARPLHQVLLDQADKALYGAKAHGRNRVTLCNTRSAA